MSNDDPAPVKFTDVTAIPANLASALAGRYALERELGRGGMASVYDAETRS